MHACSFDVALRQRRLKFNAFGKICECLIILALKVAEGAAKVVAVSFMLTQGAKLDSLVKCFGCLIVAFRCLLAHGDQTLFQLPFPRFFFKDCRFFKTCRRRLGTEALKIVGHEHRAWKSLNLAGHDCFRLCLGDLFEQLLDALGALVISKAVDDAARCVVQKRLTE